MIVGSASKLTRKTVLKLCDLGRKANSNAAKKTDSASVPEIAAEDSHRLPPWQETKIIGKPIPRIDAYERVSGTAVFPRDVTLPDILYAAILRCPHTRALVKKVDTGRAERMPGATRSATAPGRKGWENRRPFLRLPQLPMPFTMPPGFAPRVCSPSWRNSGGSDPNAPGR
jgi:hypothetical protein